MKKLLRSSIFISCFVALLAISAQAQANKPVQEPASKPPTAQTIEKENALSDAEHQAIREALKLEDDRALEAEAASARLEAARQARIALILRILAENGKKPSEWDVIASKEGFKFARKPENPND
jgi:hypothetical protein